MSPPDNDGEAGQWLQLLSALTTDPKLQDIRHLRIDGVDVWPIVKATSMMIALNEMQGVYKLGKPNFARVLYRRLKTRVNQRTKLALQTSVETDFFCIANIAPTLNVAGIRINPHLDPVRESLSRHGKTSVAAYYDLQHPLDRHFALPSEASVDMFPPLNPAMGAQDKRTLLLALRSSDRSLSMHFKRHAEAIAGRVAATLRLRRVYQGFFERSRISSGILLTNYYSPHGWGAVAAARHVGIPTFDFQHGLQGEYHHAYAWPELTGAMPNTVPDQFVCWSDADKANLEKYAGLRDRAVVAGPSHFQLESMAAKKNTNHGAPLAHALNEFRSKSRFVAEINLQDREHHSLIVGLFLQYSEDEAWLRTLREHTPDKVQIWVRRHPGVRSRAENSGTPKLPGFTFVDEFPLTAVLRSLDLAVTGYSSIGIEAAHIGCPVLAYSPLALQWLKPHCTETGFALTTNDPRVLGAALANFPYAQQQHRAEQLPSIEHVADKILQKVKLNQKKVQIDASNDSH